MRKITPVIVLLALFTGVSGFQLLKTSLGITVRDELGNIVVGATIQLFETEDDYEKEQNAVAEAVSDDKGYFRFKELKAIPYFVIVRKGDKDNSGGGEKVGKLEDGRINKVTIVIQ